MSLVGVATIVISVGFPRVSGDEPVRTAPINTWGGFSPRERG